MTKEEQEKNAAIWKLIDEKEERILSLMVFSPRIAYSYIEKLNFISTDFNDLDRADAFVHLMQFGDDPSDENCQRKWAYLKGDLLKNRSAEELNSFVELAAADQKAAGDLVYLKRMRALAYVESNIHEITMDEKLGLDQKVAEFQRVVDEVRTKADDIDKFLDSQREHAISELDASDATPEEFTKVPGLVNEIMRFTLETAPRPNRVLAFAGALAFVAHIMGRRFTNNRNARPNLYLIALADSGVGKQQPRVTAKNIALALDISDSVFDQIGSGEGVEDAVMENPAALFMIDEVDTLFNQLKSSTTITEGIYKSLLGLFSESTTFHKRRVKAKDRKSDGEGVNNIVVQPSVSMLGNGIPDKFYRSLSLRALENGLVARCVVFEAGRRSPANNDRKFNAEIPEKIITAIRHIMEYRKAVGPNETPNLKPIVKDGEGVAAEIKRIQSEADRLYDEAYEKHDAARKAIWNRAFEMVDKLALIYAVSDHPLEPEISVAGLQWAWRLYQHSVKRMLAMCALYIAPTEEAGIANDVFLFIQQHGAKGATRSEILRKFGLLSKDLDDIIEKLIEQGDIIEMKARKNGARYRAIVKKEN